MKSGGWFDYDMMTKRLDAITSELALEDNWSDKSKLMSLQKEQKQKQSTLNTLDTIKDDIELIDYTITSLIKDNDIHDNAEMIAEMNVLLVTIGKKLDSLETTQMFKSKEDFNDAYIDIQSGSGGTEAQDWVAMLLRMYLRWLESKNFKHEVVELSEGEVAGYKSATIKVNGDFAYGWLRTETGVHRLVRKSPFDSGNRRHTSFASVFAYPQVNEDIDIQINSSDLRIDVYRASGAGGQHVNTTESAVRITHLPSKIVTQCQNGRSQHKNKESAMKQLRAKLYLFEINKKNEIKNKVESEKSDISWGNQIRSYILDDSRIKDLRTKHETGNVQAVLDGDLDAFIEKSLKEGF
ncbi:MAG: Peptide chain release factor RF2 [Gammaproteobacteria bacterium]|nr:MAG: Peptide chain release factor RF2 [Gammaproteobacteria bacterium]|tara:strand:- start:5435 stop:6490 length:1056 start_codon:yes stop_codon:yes gene_type:complete